MCSKNNLPYSKNTTAQIEMHIIWSRAGILTPTPNYTPLHRYKQNSRIHSAGCRSETEAKVAVTFLF